MFWYGIISIKCFFLKVKWDIDGNVIRVRTEDVNEESVDMPSTMSS